MQLRKLRYFLALAEHLHFGQAAEALHIAQPSLSQQIQALEDELDVVLFDRSRRHVALTTDGEALVPYAQRMLALADDAQAEFADRSQLRLGHIRLGTTPTLGSHILPPLLGEFKEIYPGLELTITEDGSDRLAARLEEGKLDLALLVEDPMLAEMEFEPLFSEEIVAAVPADHPVSDRRQLALIELEEDAFILPREGYHLRGLTLDACRTAGFAPRISVSGTDVYTALRFVRAGLGVTLVPELASHWVGGVVTLTVKEPSLRRGVGIAWNPERYLSKAAATLRAFLRKPWSGGGRGERGEEKQFSN